MSNDTTYRKTTLKGLLTEHALEIPIIQRDYAQGRVEQETIRKQFVTALRKSFEGHAVELDFIYGEIVDGRLQLLDGQQRMTTIFLLHWYLGSRENLLDEAWRMLLARFSYETRASSREFCKALAEKTIHISAAANVSDLLRDASWFKYAWNHDPTIQGMLTMLDEIHRQFKDAGPLFAALDKLSDGPITFQLLEIGKIGLSDDLYIKMNARGRPLTSFESMKAQLERFMAGKDAYKALVDSFSRNIDTDWTDLIWAHAGGKDEMFDKMFQNLLVAFFSSRYASIKNGKEYDQKIHNILNSKKYDAIPFSFIADAGCVDHEAIVQIKTFLDVIKQKGSTEVGGNALKKARTFIPNHRFGESATFDSILDPVNNATLPQRVLFHAYAQYLVRWQVAENFSDVDGLARWMRVIYNLVQASSPYNSENELARSIRSIDKMLHVSNDIYKQMPDLSDKDLEGFDGKQVAEERVKAQILLRPENGDWVALLDRAESHRYFNGQIGFILSIAGILDYWSQRKTCAWDDSQDQEYKANFKAALEKAEFIFSSEGINTKNIENYSWERALLTQEDYLLPYGQNRSFGCDGNHRDVSWKRFLKDHAAHPGLRAVFAAISVDDVNGSLERLAVNNVPDDWRKYFIKTLDLFGYMSSGKRCIRQGTPHGFVLLYGERLSGEHVELYSYDWYLNARKRHSSLWEFSELMYHGPSGLNNNEPCAYLAYTKIKGSELHVDINFDYARKDFRLSVHDIFEKPTAASILSGLSTLGYTAEKMPKKWCAEAQLDGEIQVLRSFFEKLQPDS